MLSGTVTSRSKGTSRSSYDTSLRFSASIRSTMKSVSTTILAVLEHRSEAGGCDGLGERSVERRHEDDLDAVAEAALTQPRLGQERELQWGDGALDRHLGDVHDQASVVQALERDRKRLGTLEGVEVEDAPPPLGARACPGVWSGRGVVPVAMTR